MYLDRINYEDTEEDTDDTESYLEYEDVPRVLDFDVHQERALENTFEEDFSKELDEVEKSTEVSLDNLTDEEVDILFGQDSHEDRAALEEWLNEGGNTDGNHDQTD